MSEQYGGDGGESRRTDGGEPVREPLENPEDVESPAETVYNNVRDMSRREYLALAGAGLTGVLAWGTDVDGDGVSNGQEVMRGRNPAAAGGSGGGEPAPGDNVTETPEPDRTTDSPAGAGSVDIVQYLEGDATREDLTGHLNTVVWYDWMEGNKPTQETKEYMRDAFAAAPVSNPDGSSGIALHFIEGEQLPYQDTSDPEIANRFYRRNVPDELTDMVWYLAFVHDIESDNETDGLARGGINGALIADHDDDAEYDQSVVERYTANTALHELGHVMGSLRHPIGRMAGKSALQYTDSEWERILEKTEIVDAGGYELFVPGRDD